MLNSVGRLTNLNLHDKFVIPLVREDVKNDINIYIQFPATTSWYSSVRRLLRIA